MSLFKKKKKINPEENMQKAASNIANIIIPAILIFSCFITEPTIIDSRTSIIPDTSINTKFNTTNLITCKTCFSF